MNNNTNANAAPAANVKADTKAGPVKLDVNSPIIAGIAAALTAATAQDAKVRDDAAIAITKAEGDTWGTMRNIVVKAANEHGPANADVALDLYQFQAKAAGGTLASRANQYTSNLRRITKALKLGKEIPEAVLKAGRAEFLDSPFWKDAGVLAKSGAKAGSGKTAASKAKAEAGKPADAPKEGDKPTGPVSEAIADKAMVKIADKLNALHGQFKGRALALIHEALDQQLKLQATATGSAGQVASAA